MAIDTRALRNAFGSFATGVTIITTVPDGRAPIGVTANSFSSVSLDPPLVLWSLDKSSDTLDIFDRAESFAINILSQDQQDLSNHCAKQGDHSLDHVEWRVAETGAPILAGTVGHFDCKVHARHEAGDHIIMIGEVVDFACCDAPQLIFSRGKYGSLAE